MTFTIPDTASFLFTKVLTKRDKAKATIANINVFKI